MGPKLESHTTALLMVPILMVSVPTVPILMLSVDTTVMVSQPEPQASNTFLPLLPPTVFLKSTNDLLMPSPKQRLMPMLPPHTTVDTTDTPDTVVDTDMVDTVVDTDTVPDTTAVDTDTDTAVDTDTVMAVNLNIKLHSVATRGPLR